MKKWCELRNMNLEEKVKNFIKLAEHIKKMQNSCGLISASEIF
jgi:hypothetical protein